MSTKAKDKGPIAKTLDEQLTDSALDQALADRHEDVEALLEEARKAKVEGRSAPLAPLHEFLRRARERLKAGR
jgi:acyl-CoA reductase-like NAD-dependent aldehyde dehydrogenase